jgi:GNAT superfamily N-acetyltransferase
VVIPEVMRKIRDRLMRGGEVTIKPLEKKDFQRRAQQVKAIFNEAWGENWGHLPFTEKQFKYLFSEMNRIAIPELTYFAEAGGKTIGFSLTIKDANQALKKAKGRLFPFGLLQILWGLNKVTRLRTIVMGVLKEYRNRGIETAFYINTIENGRAMGYSQSECSQVVETNTKMIRGLEAIGAKRYKTYRLYEKSIA